MSDLPFYKMEMEPRNGSSYSRVEKVRVVEDSL